MVKKQHCTGARIAVLDAQAAFEQHFLDVCLPQSFGTIDAMPQKMQIRDGFGAVQRRDRLEDKV